jgi:hypothetical protein
MAQSDITSNLGNHDPSTSSFPLSFSFEGGLAVPVPENKDNLCDNGGCGGGVFVSVDLDVERDPCPNPVGECRSRVGDHGGTEFDCVSDDDSVRRNSTHKRENDYHLS